MKIHNFLKKKKMFIEHLEKRISASPLLAPIKSIEGVGMLDKLKSAIGTKPTDLRTNSTIKNNVASINDTKLGNSKFLNRLEKKHSAITRMAENRKDFHAKIMEAKPKSMESNSRFLNRIEQKHRSLSHMAQDKKTLLGKMAQTDHKHTSSDTKFLNRIQEKYKNLRQLATNGLTQHDRKHLHHRPHHIS